MHMPSLTWILLVLPLLADSKVSQPLTVCEWTSEKGRKRGQTQFSQASRQQIARAANRVRPEWAQKSFSGTPPTPPVFQGPRPVCVFPNLVLSICFTGKHIWHTLSRNPALARRTRHASMPARWTASTRRKMSRISLRRRCCTSTRWSASTAAPASRFARFRPFSPWMTSRQSGRNSRPKTQPTSGAERSGHQFHVSFFRSKDSHLRAVCHGAWNPVRLTCG